jgi:hypothetical protein
MSYKDTVYCNSDKNISIVVTIILLVIISIRIVQIKENGALILKKKGCSMNCSLPSLVVFTRPFICIKPKKVVPHFW